MSLLNWIFWRKALFTSGIIGLSSVPIALIHKYSSGIGRTEVSPYKKNMQYLSGKYASQFGIPTLTKEILGIPEMKEGVEDVFAEDLSLLAVANSTLFKRRYKELVAKEQKDFDGEYGNINGKFYDSKGGNRESMKRRALTAVAHEDFKKEILEFDQNHFTLNKFPESKSVVPYGVHLSEELITNANNWKNIGFFSRGEAKDNQDPQFSKYKFEFINFAHKTWFQEVRPFYAWMSLWKHKEKATSDQLRTFWNIDKLNGKKVYPQQASYAFPYFDNRSSSGTDTTQKFKNFFKNIVNGHSNASKVYIPKGYTEDSATSILVEGKNMYSNLYVRFAAAANYKYQQKLQKKLDNSSSPSSSPINQRDKAHSVDNYKQPTELFMFSSTDSSGTKARVKVSGDMFKNSAHKQKNEIADLVEIKDTPWVFIRNRAGIHAIAVDVENMDDSHKDVYGFFQYRTFQALYKHHLNLKQTLDIKVDQVINTFKDYLTKNFNRLILKYLYSQTSSSTFFGFRVPREIEEFKSAFLKWEELEDVRNRYFSRVKLREALINTYFQTKWDVDANTNTFANADIEKGLVGMIPWAMKTDDPTDDQDNYTFEELEKIYDFDFSNHRVSTVADAQKKAVKEYEEKAKSYEADANSFVDKLTLTLNPDASGISSDRIFTNNYYVNRINDKFLDKPDIFNEFLFKYMIKSGYLSKSILGGVQSKELVQPNFTFSVPADFKSTGSSSSSEVLEKIDSLTDSGSTDKIKNVFGKLDEQITTNYYSKFLLEKESTNPWDVAKYGGYVLKKEANKQKEKLHQIAKRSFEDRLILSENNFKNKHYKFLTTLSYLVYNNFENLLKYLRSVISYKSDSYIVFSKSTDDKTKLKLESDSLMNPFLKRDWGNSTLTKEVNNIHSHFSSVNFSDSGKKVSDGFFYLGFYNESSSSNLRIPHKYRADFEADKLYRYGSTKDDVAKYVETISSNEELKRIVEKIQKSASKSANNSWVSNLNKDQIYVTTTSGTTTTKTIKILTFQEKKNLLLAYLKDVKVEITNDSIAQDKFKDVFLTDPENSYNSTGQNHQKGTDQKVQDDWLQKYSAIKDANKQDAFKLFQINHKDVENFEKLKEFAKNTLSSDVFWAWVIDLALLPAVQDLAVQDLGSSSAKIEVFDGRWADVGNDKFVKR